MANQSNAENAIACAETSVVVIVDIQEAFRDVVCEQERLLNASIRLVKAADILRIPVVVTEQYPERLGATMAEVAAAIPDGARNLPKRTFSCWGAPGFEDHLAELGRSQVVLAGLETHICVGQTAHHLLAAGYAVHAVRDAITSRFPFESEIGYDKMIAAGAVPTCTEAVLFEWLVDSRSPDFKAVQRLVL
jgi:nicotinamidase-related amidase